jgi:hypothetical protein
LIEKKKTNPELMIPHSRMRHTGNVPRRSGPAVVPNEVSIPTFMEEALFNNPSTACFFPPDVIAELGSPPPRTLLIPHTDLKY